MKPNSARVLVVEDERIVALNLQQRLRSLGYDVPTVASSGSEAIAQARSTSPDLVLMDIRIEGDIDGIETAMRINREKRVPVVYLTAHSEESTIERARQTRPYGYLLKPFSEREMHATIQMALARRGTEVELEQSEQRLRASEERFRQLAEAIREVFYLVDRDNKVLYVSPAYEEIWGRTCGSLYADSNSWRDCIHPEDKERVAQGVADRMRTGQFQEEFRIIRPDGVQRWISSRSFPIRDAQGQVYRMAGFAEDITSRVHLEHTLRDRERALARAQQMARLAHVITLPDGTFESWSDTLPALLGVEPGGMPASTREWLTWVHPDDRMLFRARSIAAGASLVRTDQEYRLRTRAGNWIDVLQVMEPMEKSRNPEERVRWFSTLQDVTEAKAAAAEVRRLNADLERRVIERTAELEAANRELEAYDSSVAHDLRAPARHIVAFGQILLSDCAGQLDERGLDHARRMVSASERLSQIVNDLFALSTMGRGELRRGEVDLSTMAHQVFNGLRKAEPGRDVEWSVTPDMIARADPGLLQSVLENLIGNAFKFTARRDDARIEVGRLQPSDGVPIYFVRDNGAGFDMARAEGLFEPFHRMHAQSEFEGTGLGLATVSRIVTRHGGRIWADSEPGMGTTFYFTLSPKSKPLLRG
ncbi:hypothetical protein BWI17_11660 [Betaproteobacteria bacterium GR16-43]|nr:hypothetical protein BWI17_11660 [Betaproteobacteria bacterium GR16-43]